MCSKPLDLTEQIFTRLTVIRQAPNLGKSTRWECLCACGASVTVASNHLRSGATKSCGCFSADKARTHGMYGTPTYIAWGNMIARCTNSHHPSYPNYGGRGISVCERWAKFENFYADMGEKPVYLTLERLENNTSYFKENCKWASCAEQALNKRVRFDNSSGVTGVYFSRGRWEVQLYRDGACLYIGSFSTLEEATTSRKDAEESWKNLMSELRYLITD